MASTPEGGEGRGRRKRPGPPTIDLAATDVTPKQAATEKTPEQAATEKTPEQAATEKTPEQAATQKTADQPATDPPEPAASEPRAPWVPVAEPTAEVTVESAAPTTAEPTAAEPAEAAAAAAEREAAPSESGESLEPPLARRPSTWPLWAALAATLALAAGGLWLGVLHRDDAKRIAQLESRLAQRSEPPAARPIESGVPADLAARLAAAEISTRRLAEVTSRLEALERPRESRPTESPDLQRLVGRVDKLEQAPRPEPDAAMVERLAAAETLAKSLGERVAAEEAATKSLGERLAATGATENAASDRVAAIDTALRAVNDRVTELGRRIDQAVNAARNAERQVAAASEQAAKARSDNLAALRLALVAAALRDAVTRGQPFAAELEAAKPLVADKPVLAALEPFAATGVPSAAALARELSPVTGSLGARTQPSSNASVMDRLQASAERLVRIRRVDEPPGDDAAAIISRVEGAASRQDVDAALAELAKLPPEARAPAEAWIKKAQARRTALDAASKLAREATAALGRN